MSKGRGRDGDKSHTERVSGCGAGMLVSLLMVSRGLRVAGRSDNMPLRIYGLAGGLGLS